MLQNYNELSYIVDEDGVEGEDQSGSKHIVNVGSLIDIDFV